MSIATQDFLDRLPGMSPHEFDTLDFGVVGVDDAGIIKVYNSYEANMAGLDQHSVQSKNFFTHVAPCTNNRLVYGKFKDGVAANSLQVEMAYTFTYKMRPTNVDIQLFRHTGSGTNWVLVKKK